MRRSAFASSVSAPRPDGLIVGSSFVPVIVTVTSWSTVPPLLSSTVTVKVSVAVWPRPGTAWRCWRPVGLAHRPAPPAPRRAPSGSVPPSVPLLLDNAVARACRQVDVVEGDRDGVGRVGVRPRSAPRSPALTVGASLVPGDRHRHELRRPCRRGRQSTVTVKVSVAVWPTARYCVALLATCRSSSPYRPPPAPLSSRPAVSVPPSVPRSLTTL